MRIFRSIAVLLALLVAASAPSQQFTSCAPTTLCAGANSGPIYLPATGSASIDGANLTAALATLASSTRLPPLASQDFATAKIIIGQGTFALTSGGFNLLGSSSNKTQGVWIQGSGRGATSIDYNPGTSGPLFINNHGLDVKFSDVTNIGHDAASDYYWSQEQAGATNVQDETFEDVEWAGSWNNEIRATGGNNNSEWKLTRTSTSGSVTCGVYVPPLVATTITSSSSSIAASNLNEQVEVGDTGFFSASVAPMTGGGSNPPQYYVIAATTSTFQVATCATCSAITFTANGTPNFSTSSDQFLNFWFDDTKWWTGTSPGQLLCLNYGGSVHIGAMDASNHKPAATVTFTGSITATTLTAGTPTGTIAVDQLLTGTNVIPGTRIMAFGSGTGGSGTYTVNISQTVASTAISNIFCLFNLGSSANNGVHSAGVENFEQTGLLRIEYLSNNTCRMHSRWWRGAISWNGLDESSQTGNRPITQAYGIYEPLNTGGPTVRYASSQLMGTDVYINNSSNNGYQQEVVYDTVTLYDNPSFADYIVMVNNGNTGGYPIIHCIHCRNNLVSSTTGYTEIVDSDLNWSKSNGGTYTTHHIPCVGPNSNWPIGSGNIQKRLPRNAELVSITYSNPNGSSTGGAYNYSIQTTDATPVVLLTVSGASSSTPVATTAPVTNAGTGTANFLMTTDTARTIEILDTTGRSTAMDGVLCTFDVIGDLWTPANDDLLTGDVRKAA